MQVYQSSKFIKAIEKASKIAKNSLLEAIALGEKEEALVYYSMISDIEKKLLKAGIKKDILKSIKEKYPDLEKKVKKDLKKLGLKISDFSIPKDIKKTWTSFTEVNYNIGIKNLENDVAKAVLEYQFAQNKKKAIADIREAAKKAGDKFEKHAATYFETATRNFENQSKLNFGKKLGVKKWMYIGPADGKNRPFCAAHVDKVYTTEEMNAMTNDFGEPAAIFRGGWNCRHEWEPVPE